MKLTHSVKRKLLQIIAFGFSNPYIGNFAKGRIYQGKWKNFCNPGMNCYSCPAARLACPIGAMQAVSDSMNFNFSFYVVGIILAVGAVLGRWVCGFLCPFGLIQEIIAKIPIPKVKLPKALTYVKYVVLVLFVLVFPVVITNYAGVGKPTFCEFICPAGTLEGGIPLLLMRPDLAKAIGALFSLKAAILLGTLAGCMFIPRFFCKLLCPLGAIYGLLNKVSLYHLNVDKEQCVRCGKCAKICPMDVDPTKTPNSCECIRCGNCASQCPTKAISLGFRQKTENAQSRESDAGRTL